jgi:hypothetical protein
MAERRQVKSPGIRAGVLKSTVWWIKTTIVSGTARPAGRGHRTLLYGHARTSPSVNLSSHRALRAQGHPAPARIWTEEGAAKVPTACGWPVGARFELHPGLRRAYQVRFHRHPFLEVSAHPARCTGATGRCINVLALLVRPEGAYGHEKQDGVGHVGTWTPSHRERPRASQHRGGDEADSFHAQCGLRTVAAARTHRSRAITCNSGFPNGTDWRISVKTDPD